MPFISTKTTCPLSQEKREVLSGKLEAIAEKCLGKGASWVMTGYEDNCSLHFRGSFSDCAYVEVKLFGQPQAAACDACTREICALFERELDIQPDRVYVSYYPTGQWGWNGGNF